MDREIAEEIDRCIKKKISDLAKSSWNIDRLVQHKYGRVGCVIADIMMNVPIPEGKTRLDVYNRIKELVESSDKAVIENGEYGPFLTFIDEEVQRLLREGAESYLEERKREHDKLFWDESIYR